MYHCKGQEMYFLYKETYANACISLSEILFLFCTFLIVNTDIWISDLMQNEK